ncbi:transglutaminase family protein [Tessaracoccus sp.]
MTYNHSWLNSAAVSVAVWLAAWTLRPMFMDSGFLTWVPALVGVSAAIGVLGTLARLPRLATLGAQTIGMAVFLVWLGFRHAPAAAATNAPWYEPLLLLGSMGTATIRNSTSPLPTDPGLVWLLLCILALVLMATEILVNGLEQPAWALAPLGVVYGVGALTLFTDMGWSAFAAIALGYALILLASTRLAGVNRGWRMFEPTRLVIALGTLLVVLMVTPALATVLPMGEKQPWLQAGGNAPIELSDPKVALSENLRRPAEQVVLRYRTDSETPVYLRTVALTQLTTSGAELTAMELSNTGLSGAYDAPGRRVKTTVQMLMPSEYLPAPFAADRFSADGSWAFDRDTMSIVATGNNRTEQTAGLEYEVVSTVPDPSREDLDAASTGSRPPGEEALTVPDGLDPEVTTLTTSITAGATTDGQKAQAIQSFLRSEDFTYSLDAPDTAGLDDISDFLLAKRAGYCIHFAAGMITMARLEGIPARMAIGFTPGERAGDEWIVTTHNMHSWPELYFEDLGWVAFEPTKSIAAPPEYTDPDVESSASPSVSPSASATPSAPPTSSAKPSVEPTASPTPPPEGSDTSGTIGWLLALGVAVLLALPFTSRGIARLWRLRSGEEAVATAEAAWHEVEALFMDTGIEWSESSPMLAARELATRLEPEPAAELASVANIIERVRYARGGAETSDLATGVRGFRRELLRSQPRGTRLRALLLPASLLPSRRRVA